MKKITTLCAALFASLATFAQPCSTFENGMGTWTSVNANYGTTTNGLDGSTAASIRDAAGGSHFINSRDFSLLGDMYEGKCLCFDYHVANDGFPNSVATITPAIYLTDGTNSIWFEANITVTENSGWVSVCAPIGYCNGSTLPSNSNGTWRMNGPVNCQLFNNIMMNPAGVFFIVDVAGSSLQTEVVEVDNVCVRNCSNCSADFYLTTYFDSESNAFSATVMIKSMNPSSNYQVSWGDGTTSSGSASKMYAQPGNYLVCVTETDQRGNIICRRCVSFCYNGPREGEILLPGKKTSNESDSQGENNLLKILNDPKFESARFDLFPNPTANETLVTFKTAGNEKPVIRILDATGKQIKEIAVSGSAGALQTVPIQLNDLSTGLYFVELTIGGVSSSQKLVLTK